jgi:hypothetical protein
MYFIVFNVIKLMMNDNRQVYCQPDEMSFTAGRQILNVFSLHSIHQSFSDRLRIQVSEQLQGVINQCKLLKRFGRFEQRVQKRRPKPCKLLMKPRAELKAELKGLTSPKIALA